MYIKYNMNVYWFSIILMTKEIYFITSLFQILLIQRFTFLRNADTWYNNKY